MNKHLSTISIVLFYICNLVAQNDILSGPMLGYSEMKEAVVWLQTKKPSRIHAIYNSKERPDDKFYTDTIYTNHSKGNAVKLYFTNVTSGNNYEYSIYVNGVKQAISYPLEFSTQPDWSYRTDPPAFSMALGSCVYINQASTDRPGEPYGGGYEIFESIHQKQPDAMLWLGDNAYLRPADWWTRQGYIERYTHTRSLPEMQELLASCNHFAIWDDHEFGPNNATGSWIHKDLALEVFELFWANHSYGFSDLPGIMSGFNYIDINFILMDNRFNRTENYNEGKKHIFGRKQCDRLIDLLKQSRSPFKIVATGGQFLNTAKVYENHANYEKEQQYILRRLNEENIKGVVFVSGDRHHSEVMKHTLPNGNAVFEFTVSPLTSGANKNVTETNDNRIEGSLIQERNFAVMQFSGKYRERVLQIVYYNTKGEKLYEYQVNSKDIY